MSLPISGWHLSFKAGEDSFLIHVHFLLMPQLMSGPLCAQERGRVKAKLGSFLLGFANNDDETAWKGACRVYNELGTPKSWQRPFPTNGDERGFVMTAKLLGAMYDWRISDHDPLKGHQSFPTLKLI